MIEHFNQQTPEPLTEAKIRQIQGLIKHVVSARELAKKTKHLKTKLGLVKYTYKLTNDSTLHTVWSDELNTLESLVFVSMDGIHPVFTNENN